MKKPAAKRSKRKRRLEPADVLQARMEYYNGLAVKEMELGDEGSRAKIDEYLKLAQDAAKELGPYRHGRATGAEPEESKTRVIRFIGPEFKTIDEWMLYYRMVFESLGIEQRERFAEANDSMIARFFGDQKKPATNTLN